MSNFEMRKRVLSGKDATPALATPVMISQGGNNPKDGRKRPVLPLASTIPTPVLLASLVIVVLGLGYLILIRSFTDTSLGELPQTTEKMMKSQNRNPILRRPNLAESSPEQKIRDRVTPKPSISLPNVLLIEAGTSVVSNWLFQAGACHPQVFENEPSYYATQVQFFDQDRRYNQGLEFYSKRYEHCLEEEGAEILLDATPNTLEFPQRVHDIYSQDAAGSAMATLKLIFVLREPVERELAAYKLKANDYKQSTDKKNGWFSDAVHEDGTLMTFEQYSLKVLRMYIKEKLDYYRSGLYGMHLIEWAKLFNRNQLLVLNYDEIRDDPSKAQWRIEQFLGKNLGGSLSAYDVIQTEDIPKRAIKLLEPLFRKSNEVLYDFLRDNPGPSVEQSPFSRFKQRISPKEHTGLVLPNVLLIGAQKAGTSAVAEWLFSNGVCNPEAFDGEPFFFNKEAQFFDNDRRYKQGIEFYANRFDHCIDEGLDELIMDGTPNTIEHPQRVYDIYSQPAAGDSISKLKLIVILREPIDRELSSYNHKVFDYKEAEAKEKRGWVNGTWYRDVVHKQDGTIKTFTEYCEFVKLYMMVGAPTYKISRYVEHLKNWVRLFDRSHLLVLSYDELLNNPSKVQWRIEKFLGTKFDGALAKTNQSGSASKVKEIPHSAIQVLEPVFHDLNEELYKFLNNTPGPPMEQSPFPRFYVRSSNNT
eukprot:CCRYP_006514-RA/>CCRYP_006514-RA protein AED:0.02 eAED:0.02 QI:275/1/1/1/1/1/3/82/699